MLTCLSMGRHVCNMGGTINPFPVAAKDQYIIYIIHLLVIKKRILVKGLDQNMRDDIGLLPKIIGLICQHPEKAPHGYGRPNRSRPTPEHKHKHK